MLKGIRTFDQLLALPKSDVKDKRILVRADLNLPLKQGQVSDTTRLERFYPTLKCLEKTGARLVILSHLGRPEGRAEPAYSLRQIMPVLEKNFPKIKFSETCIGKQAAEAVTALAAGESILLENLRFHPGEEQNNPEFSKQLASLGDYYVNDAFSCSHRAHASIRGLALLLPAFAGPQIVTELEALGQAFEMPKHPVAAIIGGAKIADEGDKSGKLKLLYHLLAQVDHLIIGGAMANTFLCARGYSVGKSRCEKEMLETARQIMSAAEAANCMIHLPMDVVVADEVAVQAPHEIVSVDSVPTQRMILDIGPDTVHSLVMILQQCRTLIWNGPLGVFEVDPFAAGTKAIAQKVADLTIKGQLISIAGGGDTLAALNKAGVADSFSYASTAGGAFLEWLEGKELPGIAALRYKGIVF